MVLFCDYNKEAKSAARPYRRQHASYCAGAAAADQHAHKVKCYAGLMALVHKQTMDGIRGTVTYFRAAVCTTLGDLGSDMR